MTYNENVNIWYIYPPPPTPSNIKSSIKGFQDELSRPKGNFQFQVQTIFSLRPWPQHQYDHCFLPSPFFRSFPMGFCVLSSWETGSCSKDPTMCWCLHWPSLTHWQVSFTYSGGEGWVGAMYMYWCLHWPSPTHWQVSCTYSGDEGWVRTMHWCLHWPSPTHWQVSFTYSGNEGWVGTMYW